MDSGFLGTSTQTRHPEIVAERPRSLLHLEFIDLLICSFFLSKHMQTSWQSDGLHGPPLQLHASGRAGDSCALNLLGNDV